MSTQPSDPSESTNIHEWSVTELSFALKRTVEDAFGHVRLRGELGRVSRPASGHVYLDLKDEKSVINGVIWKGVAGRLKIQPEQGLEVIVTGKLTTFPGQSKYQIVIEHMEPAGVGALMALLEERKKKLQAEGLFAEERKQAIPYLPEVIGVVTSPSGAVIRDILHRLADRFPRQVLIWPVPVQGEKAAGEVAAAIEGFNSLAIDGPIPRPDVLIVARGGGSLEDLWAFNEEIVARAVAASQIPLISAIGHETDTTLIDYISDRRAPTPTAAAEMAVPVRADLIGLVMDLNRRLFGAAARGQTERRDRLKGLARSLPRPDDVLALPIQRLDAYASRLPQALQGNVQAHRADMAVRGGLRANLLTGLLTRREENLASLEKRLGRARTRGFAEAGAVLTRDQKRLTEISSRLSNAVHRHVQRAGDRFGSSVKLLETLSYKSTLERGYTVIRDASGHPVPLATGITSGQELDIEFADGHIAAKAEGSAPAKKPLKSPKKKAPPATQGDLF